MDLPVAGKGSTHVIAQQPPDQARNQRLHFFDLPGEIRNLIYGFALHEPLGLLYIRGSDNVGRLCLQFEQKWRNVSNSYNSGRVLPPHMVPEANGKFRDSVVEWKYTKGQVANQLQFVNRKLRKEIKGYGLRLNSITFTRRGNYGALPQFLDFVKDLPSSQYQHLTTIVLRDHGAQERESDFKAVCQFCQDNPHILVKLRGAEILPAKFILDTLAVAIRWKQNYRKDPTFIARITSHPRLQQWCLEMYKAAVGTVLIPPSNFRMFPADETFDVAASQQLCKKDLNYYALTRGMPCGFDNWIPWMQDWYKNGL